MSVRVVDDPSNINKVIEWHMLVYGQVQGSGFRASIYRFAQEMGLKGTVKNLPDGTVEIYAQADLEILNKFVAKVEDKFKDYIHKIEMKTYQPENIQAEFRII